MAEVRRLPLAPALRPPELTFFSHCPQVRIRRLRAPLPPDPVLADARHPHAHGQALLLAVEPPAPLQVRPRSLPLFPLGSSLTLERACRFSSFAYMMSYVRRCLSSGSLSPSRTSLTLLLSPAHAVRHLGRFPHVGRRLHPLRPVHSESRQCLHAIVEGHRASERSLFSAFPSRARADLLICSSFFPTTLFYISPSHSPTRLDSLDMTATSLNAVDAVVLRSPSLSSSAAPQRWRSPFCGTVPGSAVCTLRYGSKPSGRYV